MFVCMWTVLSLDAHVHLTLPCMQRTNCRQTAKEEIKALVIKIIPREATCSEKLLSARDTS